MTPLPRTIYETAYFVLTPSGNLHEYRSPDAALDKPAVSLHLPACTLGPMPTPEPSTKGRQLDAMFTIEGDGGARNVFRAKSWEELSAWWGEIEKVRGWDPLARDLARWRKLIGLRATVLTVHEDACGGRLADCAGGGARHRRCARGSRRAPRRGAPPFFSSLFVLFPPRLTSLFRSQAAVAPLPPMPPLPPRPIPLEADDVEEPPVTADEEPPVRVDEAEPPTAGEVGSVSSCSDNHADLASSPPILTERPDSPSYSFASEGSTPATTPGPLSPASMVGGRSLLTEADVPEEEEE